MAPLAVVLLIPLLNTALGDLNEQCASIPVPHVYHGHSCYVLKSDTLGYDYQQAKQIGCKDLPNGHLAFFARSDAFQRVYDELVTQGLSRANIGLEQLEFDDEPRGGWYWTMPDGRKWPAPYDITAWISGEPNNAGDEHYGEIHIDHPYEFLDSPDTIDHFVCEYEEIWSRFAGKSVYQSKEATNGVISDTSKDSQLHCAMECAKVPICAGFSFSDAHQVCRLHQLDATDPQIGMRDNSTFQFYTRT